jgi:hypothetical protein
MKSTILTFLALALLATFTHGQTKAVIKNITGNTITENLSFPSGTTLTIAAGATINATGATITGFGSGGGPTSLDDLTDATITTATTGQVLRYNGTAWVNYTHGFLTSSDLSAYLTTATAASTYQPLDSDLTAIAGLTSAADRLPYYTGSGTASLATFTSTARSLLDDASTSAMRITLGLGDYGTSGINYGAQFILDAASGSIATQGDIEANLFSGSGANLTALNGTQITTGSIADARLSVNVSLLGQTISLASEVTSTLPIANGGTSSTTAADARIALLPSMVGNAGKFLRVNAGATDYEVATISGGGDALTSGTLAQFAATTSAQLRGVLSDESGTGEILTTSGNGSALTGITHTQVSGLGTLATQSATITDYLTSATAASTYQSLDADLTTYAGITPAANVQSLLSAADYAAMRSQLGLVIGTNVQAYDADLDDLADGSLTGTLVAAASTTARGSVELATDGEASASVAVQGNDNRLADAEKIEIGVAISDETTALTTGTAKVTFRMPCAMTVTAVRLSLTTVSSSGTPTVDINEAGTTILSTKLTCDASEKTSTTAATAAVISDSALADDAEITLDIDTAGTGATGGKIWIIGTR